MKLTLTLQSYLLTGSGEGSALIDTDVIFHQTGFPFIPGRRIKGMLRESMIEVLEMHETETETKKQKLKNSVTNFFGKSGERKNEGKLSFGNFYLKNWEAIKRNIVQMKKENAFAFSSENVRQFFTTEIQQTAIEGEMAKDTSLRNYRVIKPFLNEQKEVEFESELKGYDTLDDNEKELLHEAVLNFHYAGTRRNRGFGKIKCELKNDNNYKEAATEEPDSNLELPPESDEVYVQIKTLSPVVLSMQLGEINTVFTEKYFSGNRLRGLLANAFMKAKGLSYETAHSNDDFKDLFLSGKIIFEPSFYNKAEPLPLHIHKYKRKEQDHSRVNVFNKPEKEKDEITKPIGGFYAKHDNTLVEQKVKTTFFFHNSRPDRAAGRSVEGQAEGGIFYYEALDENQVFTGNLKGKNAGLLNKLIDTVGKRTIAHVGRSRSAQYGEVEISFVSIPSISVDASNYALTIGEAETDLAKDENDVPEKKEKKYWLTLQSPLILLNEYGEAEANQNTLTECLKKAFPDAGTVAIENVAAAFTYVEQYNSAWQSKSGKMQAYKEGSSFLIKNISPSVEQADNLKNIGEYTSQGFGKVKIELYKPLQTIPVTSCNGKSNAGDNVPVNRPDEAALSEAKDLLETISEAYKSKSGESKIMSTAIYEAQNEKKYANLKNHLIGRMEMVINSKATLSETGGDEQAIAKNGEAINKWLESIETKPAGETLKKAGILDSSYKLTYNKDKNKTYWLTFFRMLRKLNKQRKD